MLVYGLYGLTQSGEAAGRLAAPDHAMWKGCRTPAICNVVANSIAEQLMEVCNCMQGLKSVSRAPNAEPRNAL